MTISSRPELLTPISGLSSMVDLAIARFSRMSERDIPRDSLEFLRDFLRGITSVPAYRTLTFHSNRANLL